MTRPRDDRDYLHDIVDSTQKIAAFINGMDADSFARDEKTVFAVVRAMEIMGEAAKNVSDETRRRHAHVPWADMARTRDKLIHAYFGVDTDVLWNTAREDIPSLRALIDDVLDVESRRST